MYILGISAYYHDSAAALLHNGTIVAAAQEERFTRLKHDPSFPKNAILFCLEEGGLVLEDLDAIVFYDKPLLKFERLLETYYHFAPRGLKSFLKAMPVWLNEKLFLKKTLSKALKEIGNFNPKKNKLLFPEHHLSHAASAFYPSPFKEAAILTIDGVGEWATTTISYGKGQEISILKELHFPHSLGLLYSCFTYFIGFRVNNGEYKLMGLAPYGNPDSERVKHFIELIKDKLVHIYPDGSIWLHQEYFSYAYTMRSVPDKKWEELFGLKKRTEDQAIEQVHCDLAFAIQKVTEEVVLLLAKEAKRLTKADYCCLAGGVALNCVANGKIVEAGIFKDIFIQPAAGDAGGALGAALASSHLYFKEERIFSEGKDAMQNSLLGPEFSSKKCRQTLEKNKLKFKHIVSEDERLRYIAQKLEQGQIVGRFTGRMEYGPRALGNRSILADARKPDTQKRLNLNIKYRESFRPFAPSILEDHIEDYFDLKSKSPYMLLVCPVAGGQLNAMPANYNELLLMDKLYQLRSSVPAITHVDFSARVQSVNKESHPEYWKLINAFYELTACPLIVNTSFNVRGEPIVCSPKDAINCFLNTEMDILFLNEYIVEKSAQ